LREAYGGGATARTNFTVASGCARA